MIQDKPQIATRFHSARRYISEALFLLLFPLFAYFLLHPTPINQAGTIDPYVYTGYIHNISDLLARYHLTYYSVRFGLILPARLLGLMFGFTRGYFILRYLLALLAGIPLYLVIRRALGASLAVATYSVLLTSPFLARSLLWNHPDATAVPYLLAAISLFTLGLRPLWASDVLVGFLLGLAIHSNFFTISVFFIFLLAFFLTHVFHTLPVLPLVTRTVRLGIGLFLATAMGVLYYFHLTGIWDIFTPTKDITLWLSRGAMRQWRVSGVAWIASNLQVLVLPLIALYALVSSYFRKRTVLATLFVLYVCCISAYYYFYQFVLQGDILQLTYYFAYSLPAIYLALPFLLKGLWGTLTYPSAWLATLMTTGFVAPWISVVYFFDWRSKVHVMQYITLAALAAGLIIICGHVRMPQRVLFGLVSLTTVLIGIVFDFGFAGGSGGFYDQLLRSPTSRSEVDLYRVAEQFMDAVPKMKDHPGGVRFWYNNRADNPAYSVQSTYLWGYSRCNLFSASDPGMPYIGPFELGVFRDESVKFIVLMGETKDEDNRGMAALRDRGIAYTAIDNKLLSSGSDRIYLETIQLTGH